MTTSGARRIRAASAGRRRLAVVCAPLLLAGLVGLGLSPAGAAAPGTQVAAADGDRSSPAQSEAAGNCTAYANGTSMGSYCNTGAGGETVGTLRQRFGGQDFRPCKYDKPPKGISVPRNPNPDEGRWWMQTCLREIDWDTISGGSDKSLSMQLVWMPDSADTTYENPNPLEEWLWDVVSNSTQFPVPYLRPKPNYVPLVGVPAYLEMDWLDPETIDSGKKTTVRDPNGPYTDLKSGGPFVQSTNGDLIMRARARQVTVYPQQKDMQPTKCGDGVIFYDEDKPADPAVQGKQCYLTFKRSSAAAEAKATSKIPAELGDVYYLRVEVEWEVTYGESEDDMQQLGDGFTMVSYQPLPVQEVQAPNIPPVMIF